MPYRCPICNNTILLDEKKCGNGHLISNQYDVLVLQESSFSKWYSVFEKKFQAYREKENLKIKDPFIYDKLPYVPNNMVNGSWKSKARDLKIIKNVLKGNNNLKILEIGAWNCWLTNQLCKMGHQLTAVDYFIDPYDGLGAKQHYTNPNWTAIQMNLERLDLIDEKYDVIIVNRMIVYFEDPLEILETLKHKLNKKGKIIVTGVIVTDNQNVYNQKFNIEMDEFERNEGFSLRTKSFYGPFSDAELIECERLGFEIHEYNHSWYISLKNLLSKKNNWQNYLIYHGE